MSASPSRGATVGTTVGRALLPHPDRTTIAPAAAPAVEAPMSVRRVRAAAPGR